jgi:hypothetical protein
MRVLVHCFLKWLRLFIGGLSTGADPREKFCFINTFVNSQVISSIFCFSLQFLHILQNRLTGNEPIFWQSF